MAALGTRQYPALVGDVELLGRFDLAAVPQVAAIGSQGRLITGDQDLIGGLRLAPGIGNIGFESGFESGFGPGFGPRFESPTQTGPASVDTQWRSQILAAQIRRRDRRLRIAALRPAARQTFFWGAALVA